MKSKRLRIRVKAGDTDFSGNIFHPRIFEWFSLGRIELLRSNRITFMNNGYINIEGSPQKLSLVVGEVYARFHAPIKFDDQIVLQTKIDQIKEKTIKFDFKVKHESSKKILASGYSTSVCVIKKKSKATRLPKKMIEILK
ncbi:MAG: acyl-CoA thioesterase [Candidatus Bathyarchaeia archaeon]|jgi:acyl-CoA thioester hydrolase